MNTAVEMSDLHVHFASKGKTVKALNGLSLSIEAGQVYGFLGPNGAGKTTAMHVLLGFVAPDSGSARLFGEEVRHHVARQRLGYLAENADTYPFLTGRELLHMTGRLFRFSKADCRRRADAVLESTGMSDAADRRIGTYSRGMRQRICLAQAMVNDPDLLILDEPTGGLDPFARMDFRRIIMDLRQKGKTVFFSSHELSEVEMVCDHVAIISRGRIISEGAANGLVPDGMRLEQFFINTIRDSESAE